MTKTLNYVFITLLVICSFACSKLKAKNLKLSFIRQQHNLISMNERIASTIKKPLKININNLAFVSKRWEMPSRNEWFSQSSRNNSFVEKNKKWDMPSFDNWNNQRVSNKSQDFEWSLPTTADDTNKKNSEKSFGSSFSNNSVVGEKSPGSSFNNNSVVGEKYFGSSFSNSSFIEKTNILNLPSLDNLIETVAAIKSKANYNSRRAMRDEEKADLSNNDNLIEKENSSKIRNADKGEDKINVKTQENLLEMSEKSSTDHGVDREEDKLNVDNHKNLV